MTFKDTTSNPAEKFCVDLSGGFFALKYSPHQVTNELVRKYIQKYSGSPTTTFKCDLETEVEAGTKRMDSYIFLSCQKGFMCGKAKSLGLNLSDYVLIELI